MNKDTSVLGLDVTPEKMCRKKPRGKEYHISKNVGRAVGDYKLIEDGDRIAVAVSGGKDSLCLLKILRDRLGFIPIKYSIIAVHVDLGFNCMRKSILVDYFQNNGYAYHIEQRDIFKGKSHDGTNCFWCSWNRRKVLFEMARKLGCNKLALGHHKDDIIETILLNLFFQGIISGMCPRQEMFEGKLTIIRPLAYCLEKDTALLAKELALPLPACSCPNSRTSKRTYIKGLIRELEKLSPNIKTNIFQSLSRIKKDYIF